MGKQKLPRKAKQWAKEAYGALDLAWETFAQEYDNPTPEDKYTLIHLASSIAAINRGLIDEKTVVKKAAKVALNEFVMDLGNNPDKPIIPTQSFLFAYMDVHLSFGLITDKLANDAIEYLFAHYDVEKDPFPEKMKEPIAGMLH